MEKFSNIAEDHDLGTTPEQRLDVYLESEMTALLPPLPPHLSRPRPLTFISRGLFDARKHICHLTMAFCAMIAQFPLAHPLPGRSATAIRLFNRSMHAPSSRLSFSLARTEGSCMSLGHFKIIPVLQPTEPALLFLALKIIPVLQSTKPILLFFGSESSFGAYLVHFNRAVDDWMAPGMVVDTEAG
ncbi:hypothetical protein B0H12DRAFT_198924 [Mycena haematopus]|nr:hypothetical protein B0H12DRAFT_198924 [Mycena haematopus]